MFRLLGFDVHIQSGFVAFMGLIVLINPNAFGLWLAGAVTVLTLVHELGHAVAARRTGAHAEISLGFLAGYASYQPSRPLLRREQIWISFAGPLVHISVALLALAALRVNPLDLDSVRSSPAAIAIWWAGPIIGAMNLIPILPLDGGHIVTHALDAVVPGRARRTMLWVSITLTVAGAVWLVVSGRRGFVLFIGFLLITQIQMLQADRPRKAPISPWLNAAQALDEGRDRRARRILLNALSHPQPTMPATDVTIDPDRLVALVDLLGSPLPYGDPGNEYILGNVLLRINRYDDAAQYAADSFERLPNTLSAALVARAAGALGDTETSIGWLQAAADEGTTPQGLATIIDRAPEFAALRNHPDVIEIRASLTGR